jgi:hypothetical protein
MLCDLIVQDDELPRNYLGFDRMQRKIDAAQKYVLSPEFAAAGDGFVDNLPELTRIAPFCRLPYPLTWMELAQDDRPHFSSARMYHPDFQHKPSRIGFLMEATDQTMARWCTWLFWNIKIPGEDDANNVSLMTVSYDTAGKPDKLENIVTKLDVVDFAASLFAQFPDVEIWERLGELTRSDWAGEIRYLIAVLGLLNARNVAERQQVDKTAHNHKRVKARQLPLFSHILLKLRPVHKPTLTRGARTNAQFEIRAHFVSGHFKARRTGLFFWGPHMRGSSHAGFVDKDYLVDR